MVTSSVFEKSNRVLNLLRFLRVGRNDVAYVVLLIVEDMEL